MQGGWDGTEGISGWSRGLKVSYIIDHWDRLCPAVLQPCYIHFQNMMGPKLQLDPMAQKIAR
jgi:hypothetical protein